MDDKEQQNTQTENEGNEDIQFTEEQQNKINELIASRIAKERAKEQSKIDEMNAQHEKEMQEAVDKAEKRAKMSAEERAEAERKERDEQMKQKLADLESEKRELKTKSLLLDKGMSSDLLPLVMGNNDDETEQRMNVLEQYVKGRIEQATKELMQGRQTPTNGNTTRDITYSSNPWDKGSWNMTKQNEIVQNDPEKAKQMIAQAKPEGYYIKPL
ncbi:DUF4355 domain-containing protein [Ligilactobacillus cholophilus]|uniref:DUF4355 domain-containing protein n=1 Tax=Ligilactobacillus cholophilus TaxID=3050131 RepID=UPI0025B0F862|nr:DUF4355 domain-containing protein [Ligilactobacillus cholophilus]